MTHFITNA